MTNGEATKLITELATLDLTLSIEQRIKNIRKIALKEWTGIYQETMMQRADEIEQALYIVNNNHCIDYSSLSEEEKKLVDDHAQYLLSLPEG